MHNYESDKINRERTRKSIAHDLLWTVEKQIMNSPDLTEHEHT